MPPTRYTVVTTEDADNELLTIWLNNRAERGAITRASHRMDQDLRFDAERKGTEDPDFNTPSRRIWEYPPLRVYFEVSEPDRLVRVLQIVWSPETS
jgi:hypothetical protein